MFAISTPARFRAGMIAIAACTLLAAAAPSHSAEALRHTRLVKSTPAKNDTLATSPAVIQLWFSEKVDLKVLTVKVGTTAGAVASLGDAAYEGEAAPASAIALAVKAPLAAGRYTLQWSMAGADGHPVKGSFDFVVKGGK